MKMALPS